MTDALAFALRWRRNRRRQSNFIVMPIKWIRRSANEVMRSHTFWPPGLAPRRAIAQQRQSYEDHLKAYSRCMFSLSFMAPALGRASKRFLNIGVENATDCKPWHIPCNLNK
jgi:hypothetical protein